MRQNATGTLRMGKEFSQLRLYSGGVGRGKGIPLYTTNTEANASRSRGDRHSSPEEGANKRRQQQQQQQPLYSLENFAARAIVVPVKKGHGVVIEANKQANKPGVRKDTRGSAEDTGDNRDSQTPLGQNTANCSAGEKCMRTTASEKGGKGTDIIKGLQQMSLQQPPQGALRHVIAARDVIKELKNESTFYARPHSPKMGDIDDPTGACAAVKAFGHSAAASATASLRINGQSLLKTLARRSVTANHQKHSQQEQQNQQEGSSTATSTKYVLNATAPLQDASLQSGTASSSTQLRHGRTAVSSSSETSARDTYKVREDPKESDCSHDNELPRRRILIQRINLAQHLIEAIHEQKTINWDRLPDAIRQLPAYHRRADFTEHLANAHKPISVTKEGGGNEKEAIAGSSSPYSLPLPPILCTGDTGCGKSVLVPLVVMDLHWRGVVIGLVRYIESLVTSAANSSFEDGSNGKQRRREQEEEGNLQHSLASEAINGEKMVSKEQQQEDHLLAATSFIVPPCVRREGSTIYASVPDNFIPKFDSRCLSSSTIDDFVKEFKVKSRLRIYVAQPTRLASKNLAEFLNASIGSVTHPSTHGWDTRESGTNKKKETGGGGRETSLDGDESASTTDVEGAAALLRADDPNKSLASSSDEVAEWLRAALPLGFRVGYATALDKCLSEESCEIVFATVGYLLNRLSLTHSRSSSSLSLAASGDRAAGEGISSELEFNILTQSATPNVWTENKTSREGADEAREQNHRTAGEQVEKESDTRELHERGSDKIKEAAKKCHYWGTHDAMLPFTLVLDEAHRRDLHSDLLMTWAREWHSMAAKEASATSTQNNRDDVDDALARRLLCKRRLFVMSASIDYSLFRSYFYASEEEMKGPQHSMQRSGATTVERAVLQLVGSLPFDLAESASSSTSAVNESKGNNRDLLRSSLTSPFQSEDEEKALLVRTGLIVCVSDQTRSAEDIASGALSSIDPKGENNTRKHTRANDTVANKSLSAAHHEHNPAERVLSPAASPELRSYRKLVIFGDELLQFTDDRQQAAISEPAKSQKDTSLQQLATSEESVLHRATPAALEALHAAAFSVADSRMSGHSSRAVREARADIDVYEAAAKVAVQCVGVNQHVLFFVAGYDELVRFAMAVARITDVPPASVNLSQREDTFEGEHSSRGGNSSSSKSSSQQTTAAAAVAPAFSFLKKDGANFVVDVIALHATAIGEASAQLRSSKAKAKIIVATNVAESSITIPGVSLVLNTGHERVPSPGNANRRLVTRLASKSSFLQREGRTGRTCDGVVVHLLRRKVYEALPSHAAPLWLDGSESQQLLLTAKLLFPPHPTPVHLTAKGQQQTDSLRFLVPTFSFSSLCAKLPAPITDPTSLLPQAVQLGDCGVLTNPETKVMTVNTLSANRSIVDDTLVGGMKKAAAWCLLDNASLTFKGRFVASLPLPPNLATFVFHGFMYGCLDAALITACALDVNVTHINIGTRLPQSVLEAGFYERFELAKKSEASNDATGGTSTKQTSVDQTLPSPSQSSRESIPSDVWLNFTLMDEWYSTRHAEKKDFTVKYLVSLKSMLQADEAVAMAAAKLLNVLVPLYESMGPSEHYAKARLRAALRRLQLLRKHALVNTTVLRSARYNKKAGQQRFMLPTLARCHIPSSDADHNVSLQSRLRAAFIAAFYDNLMVGYVNPKPESGGGLWGDGTRFATSAAANPWLASTVSRAAAEGGARENITGNNDYSANPPALGAFTLRLNAGSRHLPSSLLAHYSQRDVALALQRMFQNSSYVHFDILKYMPRRASLLLQFNVSQESAKGPNLTQKSDVDSWAASDEKSESLLDDEADDLLPADEDNFDLNDEKQATRERRGTNRRPQIASRKDYGTSPLIDELDVSQMILDPKPLSIRYPTPSSGPLMSAKEQPTSHNTSPLRSASFPLWLVAALPHRLREARMPFTESSAVASSSVAASSSSSSLSDPLMLEEADAVVEAIVRSPDGGLDQDVVSEKDKRIEDPEAQRRISLAKKLIQLGGRLERDERTGICTRYHLNEELMLLQNKNENNAVKLNECSPPQTSTAVRTTIGNQRDSAAIDLLKAAALGFEEWSPTEKTIHDAITFLQPDDKPQMTDNDACNNGGAGTGKEATTASSVLIASAAPWRHPSRHNSRNNDGQILANTFLAITSATVPNTVQWVASMRPKIILESISGYLTSLREEKSIHQETAVFAQHNSAVNENSVVNAGDSTSFLNRIRCPICCEVIPSETKALHITQQRHLSHLQRMIDAGVSLNALTRIVANATEGSGVEKSKGADSEGEDISSSFSNSLKNLVGEAATVRGEVNASAPSSALEKPSLVHLSPWHKKLLAEAVSDNPLIPTTTASLISQQKSSSTKQSLVSATSVSHTNVVRMKDLVAAEDAPRPIPATMGSHSLANLLALDKSHPSICPAKQISRMSTFGRSSAAAISFSVNLVVRASLGTVTANGSWVLDPSQREDAFLLLQAAVLREATVSCPQSRRPLMILVDSTHSFIFGFCIVGLYSVSFGDKPLNASVLQQLLEVKGGAARATTLFGAAEEELSAVATRKSSTSLSAVKPSSSSAAEPAPALASVPLGGAAITKLQEALIRGLQPFEGHHQQQQQQQVAKVGEERHWCPLHFPCTANECERTRQVAESFAERKQKGVSGGKDASSPSPWSPENPIETLVSGAIISLLHEAQLVGNTRQSLSFFVQRLLSNLSFAAARIGVGGRKRVVEVKVKSKVLEKDPRNEEKEDLRKLGHNENTLVVPVSLETAGGARLLEGYLKQRDAPSLEYILTYCGCVFPTTQWDGTFFAPAVLPTSVPSPLLMKALDEGTVGK